MVQRNGGADCTLGAILRPAGHVDLDPVLEDWMIPVFKSVWLSSFPHALGFVVCESVLESSTMSDASTP
jgi:hypothetical protein